MDKFPELERIRRHVPQLQTEIDELMRELAQCDEWHRAHPGSSHPSDPGGQKSWEFMLSRFGRIERELRMLNEKVADARVSQVRRFVGNYR